MGSPDVTNAGAKAVRGKGGNTCCMSTEPITTTTDVIAIATATAAVITATADAFTATTNAITAKTIILRISL